MGNIVMKAKVTYHEDGYRISQKCAVCGAEMFPCNALKVYCSKECKKIGHKNMQFNIQCTNKNELLEHYENINRTYNNKFEKKAVLQFRKDGTFVRRLDSAYKANLFGDENGKFNDSGVARCARGERKTYRDYLWIYEEDFNNETLTLRVNNIYDRWSAIRKPIVQLDLRGNFLDRYESITQARDKFLLSSEMSLINHIKKKKWCETCVGYLWMYEEDYIQQIS